MAAAVVAAAAGATAPVVVGSCSFLACSSAFFSSLASFFSSFFSAIFSSTSSFLPISEPKMEPRLPRETDRLLLLLRSSATFLSVVVSRDLSAGLVTSVLFFGVVDVPATASEGPP